MAASTRSPFAENYSATYYRRDGVEYLTLDADTIPTDPEMVGKDPAPYNPVFLWAAEDSIGLRSTRQARASESGRE